MSKILVDAVQLRDLRMDKNRTIQTHEAREHFLAFAERVAEQDRCDSLIEVFLAKAMYVGEDLFGGWKSVNRASEGGLHDQDIRRHGVTAFRSRSFPELEVAGVKQGFPAGFDSSHGTAEDMAGREQGDVPIQRTRVELLGYSPIEFVFRTASWKPAAHQTCGGGAQNRFTMGRDVVGVRMTDEDPLRSALGSRCVQPKAQRGEQDAATVVSA